MAVEDRIELGCRGMGGAVEKGLRRAFKGERARFDGDRLKSPQGKRKSDGERKLRVTAIWTMNQMSLRVYDPIV